VRALLLPILRRLRPRLRLLRRRLPEAAPGTPPPAVAEAVAAAAARDGVARRHVGPSAPEPRKSTLSLLTESDIN